MRARASARNADLGESPALKSSPVDPLELERLLLQIREGTTSVAEGVRRVGATAVADLGHSRLDLGRAQRCGHPEVVFGEGKSVEELLEIGVTLHARHGTLIVTRVSDAAAE